MARTGGDEFSVILECPTSAAEAQHVGRSLQDLLKEPLELEDQTVKTGISFGVALFPDDGDDLESLCIAADQRMYENKRVNAVSDDNYPKGNPHASVPSTPKGKTRITMQF